MKKIEAGMSATSTAWTVMTGNALEELKRIPAKSVDCVVTSPPYWSLREYPVPPSIWDAKPDCRHKWVDHVRPAANGKTNGRMQGWKPGRHAATRVPQASQFCSKCGAWCGQLGLEPTPKLYVKHLVQIFRQVKRVLKPGSPLWVNIGDTWYSRAGSGKRMGGTGSMSHYRGLLETNGTYPKAPPSRMPIEGLKPKDLVGIPWMVAFAPRIAEICISCGCPPGGTVLDPFAGRGTVGVMATRMGRNFIGIELSPQHAKEAKDWINSDAPLFNPPAQKIATAENLNGELFLS